MKRPLGRSQSLSVRYDKLLHSVKQQFCNCSKILVVDDNEMNVFLFQTFIERLNLTCDVVITHSNKFRLVTASKQSRRSLLLQNVNAVVYIPLSLWISSCQ